MTHAERIARLEAMTAQLKLAVEAIQNGNSAKCDQHLDAGDTLWNVFEMKRKAA